MTNEDDTDIPRIGNIISFATGKPLDDDPNPKAAFGSYCPHWGWELDKMNRRLTCQSCGADIDPFNALHSIAIDYDRVRRAQEECKLIEARITEMRAEEKRIRARTKNASRKDADAAVASAVERDREKRRLIASWASQIGELSDQIMNATGEKVYSRRRKMEVPDATD